MTPSQRELLTEARRATLSTIAQDGRPRMVPVCYALLGNGDLYIALDEKTKQVSDTRQLARVRDIERDPRVSLLVDRWSEDWTHLAWLRLDGAATVTAPGQPARKHAEATAALRARYPQYIAQRLEEALLLRIRISRVTGWSAGSAG
ncbi:MAG: TIGR03668 family PPOX class F420-dependent oxidoreductase [Candidatus Limnocylindrales bacterium]